MSSTFNRVITALLQWYQLRHLDFSITLYCHNLSVPQTTCHQHSHDCFIRMLSISMACSIICMSHVINTVLTALLQCHQCTLIVVVQRIAIIFQSINPNCRCFWKPIKLLRIHCVDAEISNGSYRYLSNYR